MGKFFTRNIITAVVGLTIAVLSDGFNVAPAILHQINNMVEWLIPLVIGGDTIQTTVKHVVNRNKNK
tara:strand:- start:465 stop:665 length:201 start_codon:yes stop_codon:yes gene_type:complete